MAVRMRTHEHLETMTPDTETTEQPEEELIKCKDCDEQPAAYWRSGEMVIACACGTWAPPEDTIPTHRWMTAKPSWEVVFE